jgi:hypothetical protein
MYVETKTYPMTENQAAEVLGLKVQTLRNWRHERRGPAYLKLSRRVIYTLRDLEAYQLKNRIDPEA